MSRLEIVALAAQAFAAVAAFLLARRHREHLPAAVALAALAAANILNAPIAAAMAPMPRPVEGAARALVYLDGAFNLATSATIAGLSIALAVSPERRRRAVIVVGAAWLAASAVLAALYPSPLVRGASLQRVYLAADLISVFAAVVAIVTWARAGIVARRSPGSVHAVAIGLVLMDVMILVTPFSPWRASIVGASFEGIQLLIAILFSTLAVAEVILWRFKS